MRNNPKNQEFLLWEVMTEQDGSCLVLARKARDLRQPQLLVITVGLSQHRTLQEMKSSVFNKRMSPFFFDLEGVLY